MDIYNLHQGHVPLLISLPHSGTYVPSDIKDRFTKDGLKLLDTDWHLQTFYKFAEDMGASILSATHSRYVVDLNRAEEDVNLYPEQLKTGLMPLQTFLLTDIYQQGLEPDESEKKDRIEKYWSPYHTALEQELNRIKQKFGYAILYDGHSICSKVSSLFDGVLPDFNIGTYNGKSCGSELEQALYTSLKDADCDVVLNERFLGGHITRHYGDPKNHIHAMQMEMTWRNYMNEIEPYDYNAEKAKTAISALKKAVSAMLCKADSVYS